MHFSRRIKKVDVASSEVARYYGRFFVQLKHNLVCSYTETEKETIFEQLKRKQ